MAVRWKLAYQLSYRNIEEVMSERVVKLNHSTVQKWVAYYAAQVDYQKKQLLIKVAPIQQRYTG